MSFWIVKESLDHLVSPLEFLLLIDLLLFLFLLGYVFLKLPNNSSLRLGTWHHVLRIDFNSVSEVCFGVFGEHLGQLLCFKAKLIIALLYDLRLDFLHFTLSFKFTFSVIACHLMHLLLQVCVEPLLFEQSELQAFECSLLRFVVLYYLLRIGWRNPFAIIVIEDHHFLIWVHLFDYG